MSEEEIDYGLAFDEAEDQQTGNPREKVQHYKNILESLNPLGEGIIHGIYKTEINARARNRNSKRRQPYRAPEPRLRFIYEKWLMSC